MSRRPTHPSSWLPFVVGVATILLAAPSLVAQQLTATLSITGGPQHVVRTRNGGAEWLMSGHTITETGRQLGGGKYAVVFKTWNDNFGYRWDTNTQDPQNKTYAWWGRNPSIPWTWPETIDEELRAAEAANWLVLYCQATPKSLNATATGKGTGYLWQTHEFYASMAQYIVGQADSDFQARVNALPTLDSTDPRTAGFNWANLRAARGHVAPYPVYGFCVGVEPYWVEALSKDEYAREYQARALAIKAKLPNAKLGIFLQNSGDHIWDGALIGPGKVTSQMVDFIILRDNYYGFGNPRDQNLSWFLGAYNARHVNTNLPAFNPDGTQHFYSGYHAPASSNWYATQARQWIDKYLPSRQDLKDQLVWTEWGYCITCTAGTFNDLGNAILRAGQFADGFKDDLFLNSTWTINNESPFNFGVVSRRKDRPDLEFTPTYYAMELLNDLVGSRYVGSTTTGPYYEVDPPNIFPLMRINYLDAWAFERSGKTYLFAINRHLNQAIQLATPDLAGYGVTSWKQVGGFGFTDQSDNKANPSNVVIRQRPPGPLVFEPLSISLVELTSGAPGGGSGKIWGDVSREGVVNSTDALGILSHTVGLPNAQFDYGVADVNADGQITTLDALIDLYYSVGLDVSGYRVGQPVATGNGDRVAGPQLARAPLPQDARVYVGLRPPARGPGRRQEAGAAVPDLRLVVRAARYRVEDEIGSFQLRLTWDPSVLRYRSAGSATGSEQVLLGINDAQAAAGVLDAAAATAGSFGTDLLQVTFERLAAAADSAPEVKLEVLGLGAAGTGADLTSTVEVRPDKVSDAGEEDSSAGEPLGLPYPNPAPGRLRIPLHVGADGGISLADAAEAELTVYDLRGRRVRRLMGRGELGGDREVEWDGTDERGRPVPAGIYIVELRSGDERQTRKVVIY